jgi:MFS family permease
MQQEEKPYRGPAFASALRHRTFRLFYGGLVFSSFGNNFTQLAISWQIYEITGSALQLGLLGLSRAASMIPVLLFGGLLADAIDRRRLMIITQGGQLGIAAMLLLLTATDQISIGMFYVASTVGGLFTAVETPARNAIVPNLVPESDLTHALALNATQRSVASIAGPPLAGVILGFFGPVANYAVTTLSFGTMMGVLAIVRPVNVQAARRRGAVSLQAIGEGCVFVWKHPILLSMMLLDFCQNLFGAMRTLLPVYASDILKVGPEGYGILSGAAAVGSIGGGIVMGTIGQVRRAGVGVMIGIVIFSVCTILFAYNTSFWIALVLMVGEGFGTTVSQVLRSTILQLNIPDELRGRVTSFNAVFANGGGPLGSFRAGAMSEWLGPELAVMTGGVMVLGIVGVVAASVPFIRRYTIDYSSQTVPTR